MENAAEFFVRSAAPAATARIAETVADALRPGDVLILGGDLGAGKTTFTKGLGRRLGIDETITSPTFTLAHQYDGGRIRLHHLDVYRIDDLDEVVDLALPELFEDDAVVVIEWGDKITPALPADYLFVEFELGGGDDERRLRFSAVGRSWPARMAALKHRLAHVQDMADT